MYPTADKITVNLGERLLQGVPPFDRFFDGVSLYEPNELGATEVWIQPSDDGEEVKFQGSWTELTEPLTGHPTRDNQIYRATIERFLEPFRENTRLARKRRKLELFAKHGDLQSLMRESNPVPIDIGLAARRGHLPVVQWLVENNLALFDEGTIEKLVDSGRHEVLDYLIQAGLITEESFQ